MMMGPVIDKVEGPSRATTIRNGDDGSLDDRLLLRAKGDARYLVRDVVPGETVPRVMSQTYLGVKGPRNLRRCGRIRMALAGLDDPEGLAESARAHLADAQNDALPMDVREEHYDIAGARVWALIQRGPVEVPSGVSMAFDEWLRGMSND